VPVVTRLGHRDHHALLGLVSEAAATHGAQPFEQPTIERLLHMIPADRAGYFEYSDGGNACGAADTFLVEEPVASCTIDWESDCVRSNLDSWPLRDNPFTLPRLPLKLSDFLTGARLRGNPWYRDIMRPYGVEHELKFWLPAPAGASYTVRGFFLVRGKRERDFDERDRALLALLRPHLAEIRERWERRRRPTLLTAREAEVLELVALGLTNGEIAARLVVSRTTVRTHLENIFAKLDVHTRTAAVARLRDGAPPS
jgi:DNA-binding CsgD family transcriptional regulator